MTVNPVPQGLPTNGRSFINSVHVHDYSVSDIAAMCRRLSVFRADIGRVAQLVEQVTFNQFFQMHITLFTGHVISFATILCGRFDFLELRSLNVLCNTLRLAYSRGRFYSVLWRVNFGHVYIKYRAVVLLRFLRLIQHCLKHL